MTRECATDMEIMRYHHTVIDHLSVAQCVGFAGGSSGEVQHIWHDLQVQ